MVSETRQLAQHIVREFFALVSPQLRNPWTVQGPSHAGLFTAAIQAPALPPLCTGGTFSNKHKKQVCAWRLWRLLPSDCCADLPSQPTHPLTTPPPGAAVAMSPPCVLQALAVGNVCERYLQHLADSGVLTHGWRRWPQTWMQEGGEAAHECSVHAGCRSQCTYKTHCQHSTKAQLPGLWSLQTWVCSMARVLHVLRATSTPTCLQHRRASLLPVCCCVCVCVLQPLM